MSAILPFEEDQAVCAVAERLGMDILRRETLDITDEKALKEAGLMKSKPDYKKIRRLLDEGIPVSGVQPGHVEYIFRPRQPGEPG